MLAFVRQLNVPVVAQEGEEADDVIASYVPRVENEAPPCCCISSNNRFHTSSLRNVCPDPSGTPTKRWRSTTLSALWLETRTCCSLSVGTTCSCTDKFTPTLPPPLPQCRGRSTPRCTSMRKLTLLYRGSGSVEDCMVLGNAARVGCGPCCLEHPSTLPSMLCLTVCK